MTTLLRKSLFSLLISSMFLVSCATDGEKSASMEDSSVSDAADNYSLELNGSSDNNTAGGLNTIYFDYDSSDLTASAKSTLEANAEFLKKNDNVDIQIEGHTDERGGHQYNLALGERRARSVKKYLVALGVNEARVSIVSYGKEKPVAFGHDAEAWSQNRRANFMVTAK